MKRFQFLTAIILTLFMVNRGFATDNIEQSTIVSVLKTLILHNEGSTLQDKEPLSYVTFTRRVTLEQAAMIVSALSAIQPELRTVGIGLNSFIMLDQIYQDCNKGKLTFFSGSSVLLKAPALFSSHGHWIFSSILGNVFSIFETLKSHSLVSLWQAADEFVQTIHPDLSEDAYID